MNSKTKYKFLNIAIQVVLCLCISILSWSQTYTDSLQRHRAKYILEFLSDSHSPLTKEDTTFLRFYPIQEEYRVLARFDYITDTVGFDMQTHNGLLKHYVVYGKLNFQLQGISHQLFVYQSVKLRQQKKYRHYLFIPFTDETNYKNTFGGGRYIDCSIKDIKGGYILLDFNKAYNPYCAYKEGYACPIPPRENDLKIAIEAGEKLFEKPE
ncbi:MAG: DUF1684 domain-containing protein [Chitinophagaceae bacterium]